MLKAHICLLIVAYTVISVVEVLGQQPKKCADIDEYCQMHTDCCSNMCLTYLYRCTRSYNGVYPYTFFGEKYPQSGTLDDVIANTFGNYRSVEDMRRQRTQLPQMQQRPYGFNVRFSETEIDGDQLLNDDANVIKKTTMPATTEVGVENSTTQQVQTNKENDNVAAETKGSDNVADCKSIGEKCFNNDECCSKRCHGFLHQCVT